MRKALTFVWVILFTAYIGQARAESVLESVVVYGERDPTAAADATSLTSVVEQDDLRQAGYSHASDFLAQVPGLWVSRGSGQEHLTALRSPVFTGAGACGAFWMGEDGIALRAKGFCNVNQLFDAHFEAAERAEVYKGPYAALFGSNAQFGGINFVLPQPLEAQTSVALEASSLGYRRLSAAAAGDAVAAWLSVIDDEDWRDDASVGQQKLTLKHTWQGAAWRAESGLSAMHLEQETAGFIHGQDAYKDPEARKSNENPEAFRDADALRVFSRWRRTSGRDEFSVTPYLRANQMAFLMHFVPWQPLEENRHHSLGVSAQWRRAMTGGATVFVLADTELTDGDLQEFQALPAPFSPQQFPQGMHYDFAVQATGLGATAGFDWPLTERWLWDATVRFDWDQYDYRTREPPGWDCAPDVARCRFFRPPDQTNEFANSSVQTGVRYIATDNLVTFARLANGFRIPQVAELYRAQASAIDGIDAEHIQSLELGVRVTTNSVAAALAAYWMSNRDGLYQDPQRRVVNGVQTRHRGLEYELTWRLSPAFELQASGEFARHTYANNPLTLGIDAANNIAGNLIDTAPQHQHGVRLVWSPGPYWRLQLEGDYQGSYYLDPENQARYPGHQLVHLRGQWQRAPWRWQWALNNLLDRAYADRADLSFGEPRYFPGAGRHLTLAIGYEL